MQKICALVVTYNRPELLIKSLKAIIHQSTPIAELIIIDNFSNLETLLVLSEHKLIPSYSNDLIIDGGVLSLDYPINDDSVIKIHYKRLNKNTGGAGGFNLGMRYFYEKTDCQYLWLMDDDCVPNIDAVGVLVNDYTRIKELDNDMGFICSQVKWRNSGVACKMASPFISHVGLQYFSKNSQVIEVKSASFVSMMLSRQLIAKIGLPIKEFFIWCDDAEFSRRAINAGFHGYLSLNSIVNHYSATNISSEELQIEDDNFFKYKFGIRNMIAMHRLENDTGMAIKRSLLFIEKIIKSPISFMQKIRLFYSIWLGLTHNFSIEKV